MNTNDFKALEYDSEKCWETIFKKQTEVFYEYMKQEGIEDWEKHDFCIDVLEDQEIFKDFLFRIIEELTEATEDLIHADHFLEEIVDALNFLVETMIIYNWNHKDLPKWKQFQYEPTKDFTQFKSTYLKAMFYKVVEKIGWCSNLLKNRKWKQSQYLVDLLIFEKRLQDVWIEFNELVYSLGITEQQLFEVWSQKMQCNLFRIRTKY